MKLADINHQNKFTLPMEFMQPCTREMTSTELPFHHITKDEMNFETISQVN